MLDIIDTHCHLDLNRLRLQLPTIIADANAVGVKTFVVPGIHPDNWENIYAIQEKYPSILAAYGVHPMYAECVNDFVLQQLKQRLNKSVAIGEIGLDPNYTVCMEHQECAFRQQLQLAVQAGLPVLIHCRHAFQKMLQILKEEKAQNVGGIMHAFSGSTEMAWEFIRLGFAISISAVVTRPNALRLAALTGKLPLENIVVETDAPDLPPEKYRGRANQPAWLVETINTIATIKGIKPEVVAQACTKNSLKVLKWSSIFKTIT